MTLSPPRARSRAVRRLTDCGGVWLALVLIAVKASFLGLPAAAPGAIFQYLEGLVAITYTDVLFALTAWAMVRLLLWPLTAWSPLAATRLAWGPVLLFLLVAAAASFLAVVDVGVFSVLGGFLTYPMLQLVGSVRMMRSSVGAHLTTPVIASLVSVPFICLVGTLWMHRRWPSLFTERRHAWRVAAAAAAWLLVGHLAYSSAWATRQERRIAQNGHWVLMASLWQRDAAHRVRLADQFTDADLLDFEPIGLRPPTAGAPEVRKASLAPTAAPLPSAVRSRSAKAKTPPRPLNVVLIVLESVGARWTSLASHGGYETTPQLRAEAAHAMVFDNFYAHIGRSSNSLSAMLLSVYPKLGFRDMTEEHPDLPGTSLASVFHERGYRTGFVTPSQLTWAGWDRFLDERGFDDVRDERDLGCAEPISSWGVEDRCMVDDMLTWMDGAADRPFFLMTWTQQTHHPYEPSPGVPTLGLSRDKVLDDYGFDRYLNVMRETDRQIGRVFEAVRKAGREQDTVIVVTGDHGQAFGYPHESSFMQGRAIYEEDVRVPLMIWSPRTYRTPVRSATVGSHVDLAPTIAELAGVAPAPEWQGRSLFDAHRSPRAYFYVAEDEFMLGVREDRWKYIFNVREGSHELFDLVADPDEQKNVAAMHPELCARLRRHLAAWTEADRRRYLRDEPKGAVELLPPVRSGA